MAVNLTTEPDEVVPLNAELNVEFGLTLTDGGTAPEIKSTAYRLTGGGDQLTLTEFIPYTGGEEFFNPQNELRKIAGAAVPDIGASGAFEDTEIIKPYFINYGESALDTDACEVTTDLTGVSPTKYLLASYMEAHNIQDLTGDDPVILSEKPTRLTIVPGQFDYLYVYKYSGLLSWKFTFYNADNGAIGASAGNNIFDKQVYGIPCGPGNGAFPSLPTGTSYYDLGIYNGGTSEANLYKEFRFSFKGGSCNESDESGYAELFFKEPLGGFGVIRFQNFQTQSNVASSLYEAPAQARSTVTSIGKNGGQTRFNINNRKVYRLTTEIEYEAGIDRYLDACVQGLEHYVKIGTRQGSDILQKVIINNGTTQTLNDSDSISFSVNLTANKGIKF